MQEVRNPSARRFLGRRQEAQQIHVRDWEKALQDLARNVSQDIGELKGLLKQIADSQVRQMADKGARGRG